MGEGLNEDLIEILNKLSQIEREVSEIKLALRAGVTVSGEEARVAVRNFLALREELSRRWVGQPSVLEEFRKSRGHGAQP